MIIDRKFRFQVSLSKESFTDKIISGAMIGSSRNPENKIIRTKYGFKSNRGVSFLKTEVTPSVLLDELLKGKVLCNLFEPASKYRRKDGSFGSSQKKNDNFVGSYVIGVDIDKTKYSNVEEYVSKLTLKPTFYYTSYSNMQKDALGMSNGAKFRLIYIFQEKISTPLFFRYVAHLLNSIIEEDVEEEITDTCNLNCSQYFNGTCKDNPDIILSYGITDCIYSFKDIGYTLTGYYNFLNNNANYRTVRPEKHKEIESELKRISCHIPTSYYNSISFEICPSCSSDTSSSMLSQRGRVYDKSMNLYDVNAIPVGYLYYSAEIFDILCLYDRLPANKFVTCQIWEEMRQQTKYVFRVEKDIWVQDRYQKIDENYFALFYNTTRILDGQKRRKSLYQRMCLRRYINPNITKDELVINTIVDILRFYDNSDGILDSSFIRKNIDSAFKLTVDDIGRLFEKNIEFLRKQTRPKKGIIYKNRMAHSQETTFLILDEFYNPSCNISQNVDIINDIYGFPISKSTVYEYVKNRGFRQARHRCSDEEIYELLDVQMSFRASRNYLRTLGIACQSVRLKNLLNRKKKELM